MASASTGRGLVGLFKQGWNEIPDVIGAGFMGVIGTGIGIYALYVYKQKDGDNRRYKNVYTVIRDDDPRAAKVRRD